MSNYALRIPNSLFEYAKRCAEEESVSMNQFFVMAIAEKVSALKTAEFFQERAERADVGRAKKILEKVADRPPEPGDDIPRQPGVRQTSGAYHVTGKRPGKRAAKRTKGRTAR